VSQGLSLANSQLAEPSDPVCGHIEAPEFDRTPLPVTLWLGDSPSCNGIHDQCEFAFFHTGFACYDDLAGQHLSSSS
jgi:hypothetical protein